MRVLLLLCSTCSFNLTLRILLEHCLLLSFSNKKYSLFLACRIIASTKEILGLEKQTLDPTGNTFFTCPWASSCLWQRKRIQSYVLDSWGGIYTLHDRASSTALRVRFIGNQQELPQLQHIHEDAMFRLATPKWETLFVRGCQSLRRLPFLREHPMSKVKVSGERDWWDRLQLSLPEQGKYYLQVPPPPEFASRKEKVIIKSYLR
nr:uncharacterized protein LOC117860061 isoform X2 [Setaria viridis]